MPLLFVLHRGESILDLSVTILCLNLKVILTRGGKWLIRQVTAIVYTQKGYKEKRKNLWDIMKASCFHSEVGKE